MRYLLFLLFYHYLRKIEGILMSKITHFSDSLTLTFLMFFAELFGGLVVIIYQRYHFLNKQKEITKENNKIQLIHRKNVQMNAIDKIQKIILLIFFASFFDFAEFIILYYLPQIAIISPTSDQRLCIVITITSSLLCTYALRLKTGKHHNFSLIGMSICSVIILILELIYKSKGNQFDKLFLAFILVFCRLTFVSFIDVTERYIVEYNFINKFQILSAEGFFGIILSIIYSIVIKKNPFKEMNKVYKKLDAGKSFLMIFFLILYFILSAAFNIYKIICNVIYSPMAKSVASYLFNPILIIYYFIWENDFTSEGKQNYFYFIMNIILSIVINFFALIYNEFIILSVLTLIMKRIKE